MNGVLGRKSNLLPTKEEAATENATEKELKKAQAEKKKADKVLLSPHAC